MRKLIKRFDLEKGIPLSLFVAGIVVLLRQIKLVPEEFSMAVRLFILYAIFFLICWIINELRLPVRLVKKSPMQRNIFFVVTIIIGSILSIPFYETNTVLLKHTVIIGEVQPDKEIFVVMIRGALINWLCAFMVYHFNQLKENERIKLEVEHLKQADLLANISTLKEQLKPHFLFNTFSTLASISTEQNVKDYVDELSNVYRYLLSHHKKDWVTVKEELDFCESYLYIIKQRLGTAIDVNIQIDQDKLKYKLPPLALQMIIENTFKHNITSNAKPLQVRISTTDDHVIVSNNIQLKLGSQEGSGTGLNNIEQRYVLLSGRHIAISNKDGEFSVSLPLLP